MSRNDFAANCALVGDGVGLRAVRGHALIHFADLRPDFVLFLQIVRCGGLFPQSGNLRGEFRAFLLNAGKFIALVGKAGFHPFDIGEERLRPVVVSLRDAVVFVVVTAGAPDGKAEHHGTGGVGDIVQEVLPALFVVGAEAVPGREAGVARCGNRVRVVRIQFVARELFFEKSIGRAYRY